MVPLRRVVGKNKKDSNHTYTTSKRGPPRLNLQASVDAPPAAVLLRLALRVRLGEPDENASEVAARSTGEDRMR